MPPRIRRAVPRRLAGLCGGLLLSTAMAGFAQPSQASQTPPSSASAPAPSESLRDAAQPDEASPLPLDAESLSAALRDVGAKARHVASAHFAAAYTTRDELAHELLARLECVYLAHLRLASELRLLHTRPEHKLQVVFLADYPAFEAYSRTLGVVLGQRLGFYDPASRRSVFFDLDRHPAVERARAAVAEAEPEQRVLLAARLERRRAMLLQTVIQHEAAHQIQASLHLIPSVESVPTWLAEGLATLFEVPCAPDRQSRPPANGYRLYEFRTLYRGGVPAMGDWRRWLTDDAAWSGGASYPLAWAVTAYLRETQPAKLAALLRRAAAGRLPRDPEPLRAALETHLGPLDESWATRFYAWTEGLRLDDSAFVD